MVTHTRFSPNPSAQHFPKLDQTIINLIVQQALLKLTSNTAYLNVLNYCLNRMEQLHDIRIVVIDHITTQDNRSNRRADWNVDKSTALITSQQDALSLDDPRFKAQYFSCTIGQLEQACDLSSHNLSYLNKCLDHPLTSLSTVDSVLTKIINKGWLKKRQFNQDMSCDNGRETQAKGYYRLDFVQLQHDLETIGYDLMILKSSCHDDSDSDHSTVKDEVK